MLIDEDDFRSLTQALELGYVLLPLQLSVTVWHSEINVVFLLLIHRDGSPRTCLIIFNMFRCQHAPLCGFVSTYGETRTCWIGDIIMFLLVKSVAIKLGTFQGLFTPFYNMSPCT